MLGDPTWIGAAITLAYLLVALAMFAWRGRTAIPRFFAAAGCVMAALGFNKEADLQTYVLGAGRELAHGPLSSLPRVAMRGAIVATAIAVLVVATMLARRLSAPAPHAARTTLAGFFLLGFFVVLRATSFVHFGTLSAFFKAHEFVAPLLEGSGIATVFAGLYGASHPSHPVS